MLNYCLIACQMSNKTAAAKKRCKAAAICVKTTISRRVVSFSSVPVLCLENAAVPIGFREWAIFSPPEMRKSTLGVSLIIFKINCGENNGSNDGQLIAGVHCIRKDVLKCTYSRYEFWEKDVLYNKI